MSLHKNQLQMDYISFSELDKPFIRTDKGTVKRRATLALYADYIERFYVSRSEDGNNQDLSIDTSSIETVMNAIRQIFGSLLPILKNISPDDDIYKLGLDSLLVTQAVKMIRTATQLRDRLSPRHLYASSTLGKFAATIVQLANTERTTLNGATPYGSAEPGLARMRKLMDLHKSRLSQKVNPFDLMNPNLYVGLKFYLPLCEGVAFDRVFARLQDGLRRTIQLIPDLEGRVMPCSEHEIGYKKGDLRITFPPVPSTSTAVAEDSNSSVGPRQLRYKDLSETLPSFKELQAGGFLASAFEDQVVLDCAWFPPLPADVLLAQANFVKGGCILAINVHHAAFDGVGVITALRAWAESCKYAQGDMSADCSWLDPESLNRDLPYVLYELEGHAKPAHEVDPRVWGFLGFPKPADLVEECDKVKAEPSKTESKLPVPPPFPRQFAWPPAPPVDGRRLKPTTFLISPVNLEKLRQKVLLDPEAKGAVTSTSDIVQALFWRAAIKARYKVAKELHGLNFGPSDLAIVEMPIDARPYFSSLLPASYMGSCLVTNRPYMPVEELCAPETSIGRVAYLFREAATNITPSLVHDAFTLLQSIPDYSMLTNACMGLGGVHIMMNNMMSFQTSEISFGGEFFANDGVPDTMRIQMDRFNTAFRLAIICPMRKDGGVELLLGTLPEELGTLIADEEFTEHAEILG